MDALTLTPFLEPEDPDLPDGERFVAGFKDADGNRWGSVVPIEKQLIDHFVLTETPFDPQIDMDGMVCAQPDLLAVTDQTLDEMHERGLPRREPIEKLVADMIEVNQNEPNEGEDGVLPDFMTLRRRLRRALDLVETEIARRSARGTPAYPSGLPRSYQILEPPSIALIGASRVQHVAPCQSRLSIC